MKNVIKLLAVALIATLAFSACSNDDYASKVVGTYLGLNDFKTTTNAKVVITRSDNDYVSVQYDVNSEEKELAPVAYKVRVKPQGDSYLLSGSSNTEVLEGTVSGNTLRMTVQYSGAEIVNFTGVKQ